MNPFRIDVPLPVGPLLVEASAGTGKTWSIARLVARLVAEDPPEGGAPPTIDQLLVVTFTNAAAAELRDRVRVVLDDAATALDEVHALVSAGGVPELPVDPGFAALARAEGRWAGADVLARRSARLRRAVRDFDTATIATIHAFCQQVLQALALECDAPLDGELLQDDSDQVGTLVDDWMASTFVDADDGLYRWLTDDLKLTRGRILDAVRARLGARDARVLPPVEVDWRAGVADHMARARALHAPFAGAEGDTVLALVTRAAEGGHLNGGSYKVPALPQRFAELRRWLAAGALPDLPSPHFSAVNLSKRTNKKGTTPTHPLLDAVDHLGAAFDPRLADGPLAELAAWAATEHARRLRDAHAVTFDDLLHQVRGGLDRRGLVEGLRRRFRVALIDEFQDTDDAQWEIFRRVFLEDPRGRLLLIGDPKQAIYAFRGADVSVYTRARAAIPRARQFTMDVNHRTDGPALAAVATLLGAAPNVFLTPEIGFVPVGPRHVATRLRDRGGAAAPPLAIRWFDGAITGREPMTPLSNSAASAALPRVIARDVVAELGRRWTRTREEGVEPVSAGDVAVLTFTNKSAAQVHAALLAAGVPAVIAQSGSVYASEEATWLQRWLDAATGEGHEGRARAVAVTPLFGFTGAALLAARQGDDPGAGKRWMGFLERLRRHGQLLADRGVTAATADLLYAPSEPDDRPPLLRVARLRDGERRLTNLRHLAELLDGAALAERLGPVGLARWLADRRARADEEAEAAELRLESDADTVKVVTMHRSKGLEYPIVFLPFLWDGRLIRAKDKNRVPLRFHRPGEARQTLDLRGRDGALEADRDAARRERLEEGQRLLYVAFTRAQHRLVVYTGPCTGKEGEDLSQSPLGLVLHGGGDGGGDGAGDGDRVANAAATVPPALGEPRALRDGLEAVVAASGGRLVLEEAGAPSEAEFGGFARVDPLEEPRPFARAGLDGVWRRESYTGLVGGRKGALAVVVPEDTRDHADGDADGDDDPPDGGHIADPTESEPTGTPPNGGPEVPLRGFPAGAEAGTWVHAVFEHLSFAGGVPRPKAAPPDLARLVRSHGQRNGFPDADRDPLLLDALPAILATPLGPALDDRSLGDLADADRLDELVFDLPIGPGEAWRDHRPVLGAELAACLGAARDDAPVAPGYLAHVRTLGFRPLAGFLTGTIDLVFRMPVGGRTRWFVADYKTNTLGPRPAEGGRVIRSAPEHYATPWMAAEVGRKHYYLQYLLYLVALHRYLGVRLPDYDYARDVGGAVYLFVRGMLGRDTARDERGVNGVFVDKPPAELVERLSALFSRIEERG